LEPLSKEELTLTAASIREELAAVSSAEDARFLAGYFKTGPGGYGEGDIFIGVRVPVSRTIAKRYRSLPLEQIDELLESPIHEHRLCALHILVMQFEKAKTKRHREELFDFYMDAALRGRINNWDLVDTSAPTLGKWLVEHPRKTLILNLARSPKLWERRIAIMFTFAHIRALEFGVPQHIAMILLSDKQDLIHKAVGWMLREIGNRDGKVLRDFLDLHHTKMPRTMLRYAIEKFDPTERAHWLGK
jgi:3-methyladenine DNA glycosylase AlkD